MRFQPGQNINTVLYSFDLPITIAFISTHRVENAKFIRSVLILAETIPVSAHGQVFVPTNRNNPNANSRMGSNLEQ